MRRLPLLKRDAIYDFIYSSLVGGDEGKRVVLRTIGIFGFDRKIAIDVMALADGGAGVYEELRHWGDPSSNPKPNEHSYDTVSDEKEEHANYGNEDPIFMRLCQVIDWHEPQKN